MTSMMAFPTMTAMLAFPLWVFVATANEMHPTIHRRARPISTDYSSAGESIALNFRQNRVLQSTTEDCEQVLDNYFGNAGSDREACNICQKHPVIEDVFVLGCNYAEGCGPFCATVDVGPYTCYERSDRYWVWTSDFRRFEDVAYYGCAEYTGGDNDFVCFEEEYSAGFVDNRCVTLNGESCDCQVNPACGEYTISCENGGFVIDECQVAAYESVQLGGPFSVLNYVPYQEAENQCFGTMFPTSTSFPTWQTDSPSPSVSDSSDSTSLPSPSPSTPVSAKEIPTAFPRTSSVAPTRFPSAAPTHTPSISPVIATSAVRTVTPSAKTGEPSSVLMSGVSTPSPTVESSSVPSGIPSESPLRMNSETLSLTSGIPSESPSRMNSKTSSLTSAIPSRSPSKMNSETPSLMPGIPTRSPSRTILKFPSLIPSEPPIESIAPSDLPSTQQADAPTINPTLNTVTRCQGFGCQASVDRAPGPPTISPSGSLNPTSSVSPTSATPEPTALPTANPTALPTVLPTFTPTLRPVTSKPSDVPSSQPSDAPSLVPSALWEPSSSPIAIVSIPLMGFTISWRGDAADDEIVTQAMKAYLLDTMSQNFDSLQDVDVTLDSARQDGEDRVLSFSVEASFQDGGSVPAASSLEQEQVEVLGKMAAVQAAIFSNVGTTISEGFGLSMASKDAANPDLPFASESPTKSPTSVSSISSLNSPSMARGRQNTSHCLLLTSMLLFVVSAVI